MEASTSDDKTDALVELVGQTPNLLLLGPTSCPADYDLCSSLIGEAEYELANLLLVTYTESPDTRVEVLEGHLGQLPDNVVILSIGSTTGSAQGSSTETTVEGITDSTDIQRLGITINNYLSEWESTEGNTLLCFHTLSDLLPAIGDSQRVFQFLNTLSGRIRSMDAYAHYHMDPDAHDQELISTFRPMFDEVVTFDEEGSLRIEHRP